MGRLSAPHDPVPARQRAIYLAGARGGRPLLPMPFAALEKAAQRALPAKNWGYLAGGAGQEHTMAANLGAFQHWEIVPRMLRDVRQRQLEVEVFGQRYPSPYFLSPIGVLELAHREADLAVVRAASKLQIPMVFSNQASVSMERCAAAMGPSPRWFQLYWSKSDELVRSFLQRAENCGCQALVVTLDTPLLGWRPRDLTQGYLPFLRGQGLAQYLEDPVFLAYLSDPARAPQAQSGKVNLQAIQLLVEVCRSHPGSFWQNLRSGRDLRAVRQFGSKTFRAEHSGGAVNARTLGRRAERRRASRWASFKNYLGQHNSEQTRGVYQISLESASKHRWRASEDIFEICLHRDPKHGANHPSNRHQTA